MENQANNKKQFLIRNTIIAIFGLALFLTLAFSSRSNSSENDISQSSLIPIPVQIEDSEGSFQLTSETAIIIPENEDEIESVANYLSEFLKPATGFELPVKQNSEENNSSGNIILSLNKNSDFQNQEAYTLEVSDENVHLEASTSEGLFRGIQTLRQLLPAEIESNTVQDIKWNITSGKIKDHPQYSYRGAMLDVSRHFFSVKEVKQYVDFLAAYKMNKLHLHLSDDQGWRIEIKKWPKLTSIGGSKEVGDTEGGYYTQEDYKEIVEYAQKRYITVVPEIDMPGHTNAALASYPELNCDDKSPELYTGIEVGFSSLCVDKELTYEFIDDVIGEIAAITPGPYFHIGGDESHATSKEDYNYFINRVQKIVKKHDKKIIGWDEIQTAAIEEGVIAQFWASEENAIAAKKKKAKILMSPSKRAYMDMQYDSLSPLGLHWAAYIEVDDAYDWNPSNLVPEITKDDIIGIEAPLWTETIEDIEDVEYMVFPRLPGYAEIGWSPDSLRNWEEYKVRLGKQYKRFKIMDLNFYESPKVPWEK